jgi:calcineurin-like phosphoesterase family protein
MGVPFLVTSATSRTPRDVEISKRRPALVASSSYLRTPLPESTTTSTLSPLIARESLSLPGQLGCVVVLPHSRATLEKEIGDRDPSLMLRSRVGILIVVATVATVVTVAACSGHHSNSLTTSTDGPLPSVSRPPSGALVVTAAGDICGETPRTCSPTADLIRSVHPDAALTLGDNQYGEGTLAQYLAGYDGAWGSFKDITFPVAGNHEWKTPDAQGYLDYFDTKAYWYTFALGPWRFYALDGTCEDNGGCAPGDQQYEWLKDQLASRSDRCILAYWHQPRFSSGTKHGSDDLLEPMWQLLDFAGADLVLNGHEHNYERFSQQDAHGNADANGTVEIVAGTGGNGDGGYPFGQPIPNSEVRLNGLGVVELRLSAGGWLERFRRPTGEVVDRISGTC